MCLAPHTVRKNLLVSETKHVHHHEPPPHYAFTMYFKQSGYKNVHECSDKVILLFSSNTPTHRYTLLGAELVFPELSWLIPKCTTVPIVKGLIAT